MVISMKKKINNKNVIVVTAIFLVIVSLETIGYALYGQIIALNGNITLLKNGIVEITSVTLVESSNVKDSLDPTWSGTNVNFNITFAGEEEEFSAKYLVSISNSTYYEYKISGNDFSLKLDVDDGTTIETNVEGVSEGGIIPPRSDISFYVIITLHPADVNGEYGVEGGYTPTVEKEELGDILASISSSTTGNLRGSNTLAPFTVDVLSSYDYDKKFSLSISNNNFEIVDANGNRLGVQIITKGDEKNFDFYIKKKDGGKFSSDTDEAVIYVTPEDHVKINAGTVTLLVDQNVFADETPPTVTSLTADYDSSYTEGTINVNWSATDDVAIKNYTLSIYSVNGSNRTLISNDYPYTTNSDSYIVTGLSEGSYEFEVYATDTSDNVSSVYTSTTYNFKWNFNVSKTNLSGLSISPTTAKRGKTYSGTITVTDGNDLPSSLDYVKMGGKTLSSGSNGYRYTSSSGNIEIYNVNGDIDIKASSSRSGGFCLIEGTKIRLANGDYKNIEDITYYDLLAVWNYDTGTITYEYPIWIEKTRSSNSYQKITFSDGTVLNISGFHGIFDTNNNMFVRMGDSEEFNIGTEVLKISNDNKFYKVKVDNIETINEKVNYYHVVSTRYYNIIADDFLTTDDMTILSNIYGFDSNLKWLNKDIIDFYNYDDFSDIVPYYMFKGLRMEEAKYLENYGITKDIFRYYLLNNQLNPDMLLEVPKQSEKRIFAISTSDGNINYLLEGEKYILPDTYGYWYNTSDNKIYHSNEIIDVTNSMHFISIKE